jgi:LuxR family maltose regulon positive regulatory protein
LILFKALLCDRLGERAAAVQHLRAALALAEPRGLIRTFVDAGPGVEPLLKTVAAEFPTPYVMQLLEILHPTPPMPAKPQVQLTRRESETLMLLGQRRTDRDIADELVVSTVTVRTHINHLSEKLGVRGRRAIVTRAREMGLLT